MNPCLCRNHVVGHFTQYVWSSARKVALFAFVLHKLLVILISIAILVYIHRSAVQFQQARRIWKDEIGALLGWHATTAMVCNERCIKKMRLTLNSYPLWIYYRQHDRKPSLCGRLAGVKVQNWQKQWIPRTLQQKWKIKCLSRENIMRIQIRIWMGTDSTVCT